MTLIVIYFTTVFEWIEIRPQAYDVKLLVICHHEFTTINMNNV